MLEVLLIKTFIFELILTCCYSFVKCLFLADDVLDHIPMFQNLTHLELSRGFENNFIGVLLEFLQFLPKLESLLFLEVDICNLCACYGTQYWAGPDNVIYNMLAFLFFLNTV